MIAEPTSQPESHGAVSPTAPLARHGGALDSDSLQARELLETLDDAMFAAIAGDVAAVAAAEQLWQCAIGALDGTLIEESREQYLRYASEMTRRCETDEVRDPAKALVNLEIIELLAKM